MTVERNGMDDDGAGGRLRRAWQSYTAQLSYAGLVAGTVMLWLSATPSLLPRGPLFQGLVSAGAAALGYALGAFATWLARFLVSRRDRWRRPPRIWWIGLGIVFIIGTLVMLYWYQRWQSELRDLMGVAHLQWSAYPTIVVVAVIVFAILVGAGQAWGALVRILARRLSRRVPPRISGLAAATVMVIVSILIFNGVVADYGMNALNSSFAAINDETNPDSEPTTSTLRSGGPESLVSWASLGRLGRTFVSVGPSAADISEFNRRPAKEPIRVYAGLQSADSIQQSADLAARELVRTGGLQRKLIGIAGSTGTGWVNQANLDTLEYMYNGDTAMVSMQYSMLPSWLSFLVDQERARTAGRALFEAVDRLVRKIPEAERPMIVVFGESLGSFSVEAPFGSVATMSARTDGALLTGPTFSNQMWADATGERDAGSPEVLPIVDDGNQVRFINTAADLDRPSRQPWDRGRIVYLQHASDPISWWNPELILNKPDWLREKRGSDVLDTVSWIPFVTFLQVAADMAVAADVPDGHGHHYLREIPQAWAKILTPEGWTDAKTQSLLPRLRRD
ncbi:alpha/beta hydrolase [Gordonia hydrophobica]|uniref:Alpha/beta-hydrolase family protein n=1 Tax=Gordonia hydrophobica TaxID=40516 RepID=A0ABZ2TZI0_9ACTN|nr:alpha/beta-hydrolase family protein [Gordonia hydrophobica]MBM7368923.1 putative membrane protein [Gordonia hydrophobica]